ncbi:hypothetical protein CDEST_15364 [Colletotrichum destructivum]|uniref:Uncharacterized protein n=1 Tax=Colletotrichum destructivum TaxID=34406 RepID=A0AAX4J4S8_9PEZI|nr:hypothetical protein CDEST_15364 [Colletotrichum destructivum]
MVLQIQTIDDPEYDFSEAEGTAQTIIGKGQVVTFKDAFIWEYKTGQKDPKPINVYGIQTGKTTVPSGTTIYVGGSGGKVNVA